MAPYGVVCKSKAHPQKGGLCPFPAVFQITTRVAKAVPIDVWAVGLGQRGVVDITKVFLNEVSVLHNI